MTTPTLSDPTRPTMYLEHWYPKLHEAIRPDLGDLRGIAKRIEHTHPDEAGALHRYIDSELLERPVPPPTMTHDEEAVLEMVIANRRSERTRVKYQQAFDRFRSWCEHRTKRDRVTPTHPTTVVLYLLELYNADYKIATLNQATTAISHHHRERNMPDPTDNPRVRAFLSGARRARKEVEAKQAKPITEKDFATLKAHAPVGSRLVALIGVMRDAMLRVSEAAALTGSDIVIHADGSASLTIRHSKTDQSGKGETRYLRPSTTRLVFPLLIGRSNERVFPFHPDTLSRQITKLCKSAGLGDGYSGHSPRVGMSLDLVRRGASLPEVQQAGRWKSPAMVSTYTRNEQAKQGAVARLMEEHANEQESQ